MKTFLHISSLLLLTFALSAQSEATKDREIQVEKNYNNEIYAVHPVFDFADIKLPQKPAISFAKDSMAGVPVYAPNIDIQVKPIAYKTAEQEQSHRGMLKLDKGTINPLHAQAGYVYSAPNYFNVVFSGNYDNWKSNLIGDQYVKNAAAALGMTYYISHGLKSNINLTYNNNKLGLYGHQMEGAEPIGSFHHFNTIGGNIGIETFKTLPQKWNAGLQLQMNQWSAKGFDGKEQQLTVLPKFQFKASEAWTIKLQGSYDISRSQSYGNSQTAQSTLIVSRNFKNLSIEAGATATLGNSSWSFWPSTNINWQLGKNRKLRINSAQDISIIGAAFSTNLNPYTDLNSLLAPTSNPDWNKGIRNNKKIQLEYRDQSITDWNLHTQFAYHDVRGGLNFKGDATSQTFEVSAVDYKLLSSTVGATYAIAPGMLNSGISFTYNKYLSSSDVLLHRGDYRIEPSLSANILNDKLQVSLQGNFSNPQLLEVQNGEERNSSWRADVSFEAKYSIMDRISIYANADNILDNQYEVWNGYNNFGRNLSAGILIKL